MYPALNHWTVTDDLLAPQFGAIGNFGAIFARSLDPELTFHAPMTGGSLNSIRGYRYPTIDRASAAGEASAIEGHYRDVGHDAARIEYQSGEMLGLLGERASTNVCLNYNRAPDAALTGLTLTGETTATLTRVSDQVALQAAGLAALSRNQYVYRLSNLDAAAVADAIVTLEGVTGMAIAHTMSLYARGSGTLSLTLENETPQALTLTDTYQRLAVKQTPAAAGGKMQIRVPKGSEAYWLANQLEDQVLATSVIEASPGAAVSRAQDLITYPLEDVHGEAVINQLEGMAAVEVMLSVDPADAVSDQGVRINRYVMFSHEWIAIQFQAGNYNYVTRYARSDDNPVYATTWIGSLKANTAAVMVLLWERSTGYIQSGWKSEGIWRWGTARTDYHYFQATDRGLIVRHDAVPTWQHNLKIWRVNRGTAWLEAQYAHVANG